eukprot:gene14279-biopygen14168
MERMVTPPGPTKPRGGSARGNRIVCATAVQLTSHHCPTQPRRDATARMGKRRKRPPDKRSPVEREVGVAKVLSPQAKYLLNCAVLILRSMQYRARIHLCSICSICMHL